MTFHARGGFWAAPVDERSGLPGLAAGIALMLALLLASFQAYAQDASPLPSKPTLDLPVGQGRLMRFYEPVESVLIADTTIADLQIVSPNLVYVFGLKPGLTNLIAITADEKVQATAQFRVYPDISPATQAKRAMRIVGEPGE